MGEGDGGDRQKEEWGRKGRVGTDRKSGVGRGESGVGGGESGDKQE